MRSLLLALAMTLAAHAAQAVGFQWATAPGPNGAQLQVAIWYPSPGKPDTITVGPFDMQAAQNGSIAKGHHPLIVMSHGTGGMALISYDTAIALAKAGFIVAALTHAGDNYRDQSVAFTLANFTGRPIQVSRTIEYLLTDWPGHDAIDPARIGVFGHSAGGTTALLLAGGVMDWNKAIAFCLAHPDDWGCKQARAKGSIETTTPVPPITAPDPRVKAIAIAAPALGHTFVPNGLANIHIPIQLWIGTQDTVVTDAPELEPQLAHRADIHLVRNAGHFAYLAPCTDMLKASAREICADPKGFNRAKFLQGFQRSLIAFFRASLR